MITSAISRRDMLKGTLASLVGALTGASIMPSPRPTIESLLHPDTGLAKILREANESGGSFYNRPVLQSVGRLAELIGQCESESIDPNARRVPPGLALMRELDCNIPGTSEANTRLIHGLLNMDANTRRESIARIDSARTSLQLLRNASPTTNDTARSLAAEIYFRQKYVSDDGFVTSSRPIEEVFTEECNDPQDFFLKLVDKALNALDAERLVYEKGEELLKLRRHYPALEEAFKILQRQDYLSIEQKSTLFKAAWPTQPQDYSPTKDSKTRPGERPLQSQCELAPIDRHQSIDTAPSVIIANRLIHFLRSADSLFRDSLAKCGVSDDLLRDVASVDDQEKKDHAVRAIRQILTSTTPGHTLRIQDYNFFIRDLESFCAGTGSSLLRADKDPEEELKRLVQEFHQTISSILSQSRCETEQEFARGTLKLLTANLGDALPEEEDPAVARLQPQCKIPL